MNLILSIFFSLFATANVKTEIVKYELNGTKFEGFIAFDDKVKTPSPGFLIVHDWMGIGDYTKNKAKEMAKKGYVGFAVDIFGKGNNPKNQDEAAKLAGKFKEDRVKLRAHIQAAYEVLSKRNEVNKEKIFVFGYCFGGTTALELGRAGAKLAGIVSFHGGLSNPKPADAKNIQAPVLILHGADDPFVPAKEVTDFKSEMRAAKKVMQFVNYAGVVHSFTNPLAGDDKSKGAAYNEKADKESWVEFEKFVGKNI